MSIVKTISRATLGLTLASMPLAALAAPTLPTPTPTPKPVSSAQQSAVLNRLKTKGAFEIDRRLTALQNVQNKTEVSTKLAAAEKEALTKQLKDEIAGLTALKTKLNSETALTSARTDIQSIWLEYRVYALLAPKARLIVVADRLAVTGEKLRVIMDKLEAKVKGAKAQGKEVADLEVELANMKTKLITAEAAYRDMVGKVINLQPGDYVNSHRILTDYRDSLKVARSDFASAQQSAKEMITGLNSLKDAVPEPSPTTSASPSPTSAQ